MCNIGTVSCCLWNTQASDYRAQCLAQLNGKGTDRQATFVNCETEGHIVILDSVSVSTVESRYDMFVRVKKRYWISVAITSIQLFITTTNKILCILHTFDQQYFLFIYVRISKISTFQSYVKSKQDYKLTSCPTC